MTFTLINLFWKPRSSPRVELQMIDFKKLDAIKKQWKMNRAQKLLIDPSPSQPSDPHPPQNAEYFSQKNIRVKQQQRAQAHIERTSPFPKKKIPSLGNLGVPLLQNSYTGQTRQNILDRELPEGSENLLNAQESIYYSFYQRLYSAIAPLWQTIVRETELEHSIQPGEYSTTVDVVFDAEGNLVKINILQRSGIQAFDQAVQLSWRKVHSFPNPPKALLDPERRVHTGWTFVVRVGPHFDLNYIPPARNY